MSSSTNTTPQQMNGDVKESPSLSGPILEGGEKVVLGGAFSKFIPAPKPDQPAQPKTPRTARYLNFVKLLTVRLIDVYRRANPAFEYFPSFNPRRVLTHPSEGVSNQSHDNSNSDYIVYVNDIIGTAQNHRYHVLDLLGQGTFGQVVKCQNCDTDDLVALKILKNKPAYLNQGLVETRILEMLNNHFDPDNKYHTVRLLDYFMFRRHLCLVFELLSVNLYELIKQNHFRGLSTNLIRVFMIQMLEALTILLQSNIIHCDLKPENVLLYNLNSPTIKLIDFGSACFENQTVYSYIQSRHYRSPEVLVGHAYSAAIDMWSLGCIAAELYLGLPLFPGTSEFNQLCRIVEMQGPPPDDMLDRSKQASKFFNKTPNPPQGQSVYTIKTEQEFERDTGIATPPSKKYFNYTTLDEIIQNYAYKKNMTKEEVEKEKLNRRSFCNFVQGLLQVDPKNRWTPMQAKTHPFITGEPYTGPFTPEPAAPKPPPNPRTSAAGSLGFYPPNLQNFPPIPPPIANGGVAPPPMNGGAPQPHVPPLPTQPSAKKPPPGPQVPMLPNLGLLKQQEFNQNPADNYSPRGYFAHVMQQQHPAQLLGASPSTHHFQSPQHYMYGHHQQHYMGASPNLSYNPMWGQDFGGGNYPRSNRARSKSEANYGGPPIPPQQLLMMQHMQYQQQQQQQSSQSQQHPPIHQHHPHGPPDGAEPPIPATPTTPSQQTVQVSPRRRSHSQSHPTNPYNLYLGESPRITPGVLKESAPPFYPRDMANAHNIPSPSTNNSGGGGGGSGNRGRNQHQNPSNNSGNRSRSKSFGDSQHHGQQHQYPAQGYQQQQQQQYPYQSPHQAPPQLQQIPEVPQTSPHIPQLQLPPHPMQQQQQQLHIPQLQLQSLPHHQPHLQSPHMPQLQQSPHQPSPHQPSPHQPSAHQQSPRQANPQSPRQQPTSPHQPQSPTPHQQYNSQHKHYQQKHAYVQQSQGQTRQPSSPRGSRHQQPNSPRGKPPPQSPDTPLSPPMDAIPNPHSNSNSNWDSDDSLLFQFDPPTPTKSQGKKQHTPQQPSQQQAWRRKSPEGNQPPNYQSHPENRRSGGYKIPLGESFTSPAFTSPASIPSSPYVPYDRDTANLLGFSPYQAFSHSPPEQRDVNNRGGRGSKNYGQSPFYGQSPPDRKGGKPMGTPNNLNSNNNNRFTQQSPPKPITGGKKYNAPSSAGTTPTSSSPNPRSPSGFSMRSPPTQHNPNNNSHKSPRQNTLYSPAQAAASISTPNMQKPPHWNGPRRSNSFYTNKQQHYQQPYQNNNLAYVPKGEGGKEDGEGFMLFSPDDETSPPSDHLPDTFSPYTARNHPVVPPLTSIPSNNNNNTLTSVNSSSSSGSNDSPKSLPEVPDTT